MLLVNKGYSTLFYSSSGKNWENTLRTTSVKITPNNNYVKENIFYKKYVCINFLCKHMFITQMFFLLMLKNTGKRTN